MRHGQYAPPIINSFLDVGVTMAEGSQWYDFGFAMARLAWSECYFKSLVIDFRSIPIYIEQISPTCRPHVAPPGNVLRTATDLRFCK